MHDPYPSHLPPTSQPPPSWPPLRSGGSRRGGHRWLSLCTLLLSHIPSLLHPFLRFFPKYKCFPGLEKEVGREESPRGVHPHDEEPKEERIGTKMTMPPLLREERVENKPDKAVDLGKEGRREGERMKDGRGGRGGRGD